MIVEQLKVEGVERFVVIIAVFVQRGQPFIEGATQLNPSMLDGVKALAETILILTAADILNGLTSWLTGGSSLSDFATQLVPFGCLLYTSLMSLSVKPEDGEAVLFGKAVNELQSDVVVADDEVYRKL